MFLTLSFSEKRPLLAGLRDIRGELAEPAEEALALAVGRLVRDLGADPRGVGEIEGGKVEQTVDLVVDVENVEPMQTGIVVIGVFPGFAAEKRKFE